MPDTATTDVEQVLRPSRRHSTREGAVRWILRLAGATTVLVSFGIVFSLIGEATTFLRGLPDVGALFSELGWSPGDEAFDLRTLLVPTLWIALVAMAVAVPLGLGAAIYLAEYADRRARRILKPIMEILAGVPSVVIGFFALTFITPNIVQAVNPEAAFFNMVSAGLAVGVLASPYMASVSEDALGAVPHSLREASFGLGARQARTVVTVVLPAAISGLVAGFVLTLSRVIGETMIVTIAAGSAGKSLLTASPFEPGQTLTAAIANLTLGSDAVTTGYEYQSLYFLGLLLFLVTLGLNVVGDRIVRRYRKAY